MEKLPLLTMTKSRIIGDQPTLSNESQALLDTLSGLCSFHTPEDLASFLFTDMFRNLVGAGESWIILKSEFTKTTQKRLNAYRSMME